MDMVRVRGVGKSFKLHAQGGAEIAVVGGVDMTVAAGDAIALTGASGVGKSTLMRMIFGNYLCPEGEILVRHGGCWVDVARADPRAIIDVRRETIGYISQFLRVIPRVPALEVVAEPIRMRGASEGEARERASELLTRLRIPETLWSLSPVTFSGGEQQRVNIARGFAVPYPILLLDEPTASLDKENRDTVIEMIDEARRGGTAIIGIFHDGNVRAAVCERACDLTQYRLAS